MGAAVTRTTATCANGIFQTLIASRIRNLRTEAGGLDSENALLAADRQFAETAQSIQEHAANIRASLARIDAAATELRNVQAQGRAAAVRALFLDASTTGAQLNVDTVMHRRFDSTLARYTESHTRAIRLAYIARIALEQRLGLNLSEISDDLVSVDAPAGWVDELCTMSPIDYEQLRNAEATLASPDNYVGFNIRDYVRRLEQVFQSYSFAYPFQAGTDRVVLSLRDDINRIQTECEGEVPNLLYQSRSLVRRASTTVPGWVESGCTVGTSCVLTTVSEVPGPIGVEAEAVTATFTSNSSATALLSQPVQLSAGRYRLSWWALAGVEGDRIPGKHTIRALNALGWVLPILNSGGPVDRCAEFYSPAAPPECVSGWRRYDYVFDVTTPQVVSVAVMPNSPTPSGRFATIAGIQLTVAPSVLEGDINAVYATTGIQRHKYFPPGRFYPTDDSRVGLVTCPDDGTELRRRAFSYGCTRACRDGYDGTCTSAESIERCYWQTAVSLSSDDLGRTITGTPAGFAGGNFNYRVEDIGLNFVGTALRNCPSDAASGCFGSGNLSYSLVHQGPWFVRNAEGGDYLAPLFPGRIESARALAAERYITNPVSSADEALLTPYMRHEFRGRPMSGTLLIRVWDDPGFAWENLEDIQLVLNYRYWTHQR